jgi:hypothetical protein
MVTMHAEIWTKTMVLLSEEDRRFEGLDYDAGILANTGPGFGYVLEIRNPPDAARQFGETLPVILRRILRSVAKEMGQMGPGSNGVFRNMLHHPDWPTISVRFVEGEVLGSASDPCSVPAAAPPSAANISEPPVEEAPGEGPPNDTGDVFRRLGIEIGELVARKDQAYGSSFEKAGDFLQLLFPKGIPPERYGDALAVVRIFDKLMRIATDRDALGETPFRDIAGYGILGAARAESE